jgi:tetratricopeptide (TPR) repeat protein
VTAPSDHITVTHGSLTVRVPRSLFIGRTGEIDPAKASSFRENVQNRYPWITDNSLDVLMRSASREMERVIDEESGGRVHSRELEMSGRTDDAIAHLKRHLESDPGDADGWYALGDLLCRCGRTEEGYKAFARGRDLI